MMVGNSGNGRLWGKVVCGVWKRVGKKCRSDLNENER